MKLMITYGQLWLSPAFKSCSKIGRAATPKRVAVIKIMAWRLLTKPCRLLGATRTFSKGKTISGV